MNNTRSLLLVSLSLAVAVIVSVSPTYGQVMTTPSCTTAMISSITPCMNFLTSNSTNGTLTPNSDCCTSLQNLTNGGMGCVCLLVTGSVPFQIPINRTLAISLPRACNMPGVPVQCKATASAPVPAPGPSAFVPVTSPSSSPAPTGSSVPKTEAPSLPPESDTTPSLTPSSTPTTSSTTGSRSNMTPSSEANASRAFSPAYALLVALASALFYYP